MKRKFPLIITQLFVLGTLLIFLNDLRKVLLQIRNWEVISHLGGNASEFPQFDLGGIIIAEIIIPCFFISILAFSFVLNFRRLEKTIILSLIVFAVTFFYKTAFLFRIVIPLIEFYVAYLNDGLYHNIHFKYEFFSCIFIGVGVVFILLLWLGRKRFFMQRNDI